MGTLVERMDIGSVEAKGFVSLVVNYTAVVGARQLRLQVDAAAFVSYQPIVSSELISD
jgi:hypothetical protein